MQTPALICVLRGPEHVAEFVNPPFQALIGRRAIVGKPIRDAFPELEGQGLIELLDAVYRTGESYVGKEMRSRLDFDGDGITDDRYFDFVYQPTRDPDGTVDGIFVHAVEVTDGLNARRRVEALVEERTIERDRLRSEIAAREHAEHEIEERVRQAALGADIGAALTSTDDAAGQAAAMR